MNNFHESPQDYTDYRKYNNIEEQIDIFEETINLQDANNKEKRVLPVVSEKEYVYNGPQYYKFQVFKFVGSDMVILDYIVAKDYKEAGIMLDKTKYKHDDRVSISKMDPCEPPEEVVEKYRIKRAMTINKNNKRDNLQKIVKEYQERKDIF